MKTSVFIALQTIDLSISKLNRKTEPVPVRNKYQTKIIIGNQFVANGWSVLQDINAMNCDGKCLWRARGSQFKW